MGQVVLWQYQNLLILQVNVLVTIATVTNFDR